MGSRFSRTSQKTEKARNLRCNATKAEQRLWFHLRGAQIGGFSFRRQHPAGRYVLDFYCPKLRLAIELDGDQHGWESHQVADAARDRWLARNGVTVMHFWNSELLQNLESALETIHKKAEELFRTRTPSQPSPFQGEEEASRSPLFGEIDR